MAGKRPNKKSRGMITESGCKARKERRRNKSLARFAKRKRDLESKISDGKELTPGETNRASKYRFIVKTRIIRNSVPVAVKTEVPAAAETVGNPPS